jgi:hypothetical protein
MAGTPEKKEWGGGRLLFRAHRAAIFEQLDAGRSRKAIWREFCDRLGGLGYVQFTRHIQTFRGENIPPAVKPAHEVPRKPSPHSSPNEEQSHDNLHEAERTERPTNFHFDPMDAYRKKYV